MDKIEQGKRWTVSAKKVHNSYQHIY